MKDDNKIEKIKSEENDFYVNDDIYTINSWGADLSFRELVERYNDDELIKPELQRKYVWDKTEASRFIDSLLLGLPVPSIFLAKQENEKLLIVDGYQRIMTVRDYISGIFTGDGKVFKLTRSNKINARWMGKAFSELSDTEQRRIKNTTIHAIIFSQSEPSDNETGMYQVFERINTSGRTLFPQEIRNCVYHGKFNKLLLDINKNEEWRKLFGSTKEDSRMRDIEFILRFLAIRNHDFKNETSASISLKKFLNEFMKSRYNNTEERIIFFENQFIETIKKVSDLFGKSAFHNISSKHPNKLVNKFNPTIFDSIMTATSLMIKQGINFDRNDYESSRLNLLRDECYQNAISTRTTNVDNINTRISLALKYLFDFDYEEL